MKFTLLGSESLSWRGNVLYNLVNGNCGRTKRLEEDMSDNSTETLNGSHDQKLDQILAALNSLRTRLEQVETKVDERLRETRPIWEAVQAQMAELKESQQSFRSEVEKSFRLLDRRMEMYAEMVARVHAYE
jgi:chromosome segregation ATPase